jgi:hypothetical protein
MQNIIAMEQLSDYQVELIKRIAADVKMLFINWNHHFPKLNNAIDIFTIENYMQDLSNRAI